MGEIGESPRITEEDLLSGELTEMTEDDTDLSAIEEQMAEIEEEQKKLKAIQSELVGHMSLTSTTQSNPTVLTAEEKAEADAKSVYVGNVDYGATAEDIEQHFHGCGSVSRVTILCDKFSGHPKGFAYVEFADREGMQNALAMTDSLLRGRQIKVNQKRTNKPGISTTNRPPFRGRGRGMRGGVIIKYVYPGGFRPRGRGIRGRRPGFAPY
ncbi:unnamed protein product [Caenorhabditis auriculariae]|uniref:RRM domain-containing protein n=1 Tax=Caenorhabditis auriculariae TaxID=2777116 RepID=A0A8S1GNT1_9PELO|nr:unnamed protein product [Caenorhabditis auriculariae]